MRDIIDLLAAVYGSAGRYAAGGLVHQGPAPRPDDGGWFGRPVPPDLERGESTWAATNPGVRKGAEGLRDFFWEGHDRPTWKAIPTPDFDSWDREIDTMLMMDWMRNLPQLLDEHYPGGEVQRYEEWKRYLQEQMGRERRGPRARP